MPVIIINKTDKCTNIRSIVEKVESISYGIPYHLISALNNEGMNQIRNYLKTGVTIGLFGSSGVGKTTIIIAY